MFSEKILNIASEAEKDLAPIFAKIDEISFKNTARVLESFKEFKVAESMFAGTTGYGYDDIGRDTLDKIYADVFGAESAFVRHSIANGTSALTIGLFGLLRPNDVLLSVTNQPYDTLCEVIGINGANGDGSLADFGVKYDQVDFKNDVIDFEGIEKKLNEHGDKVKVVEMQAEGGAAGFARGRRARRDFRPRRNGLAWSRRCSRGRLPGFRRRRAFSFWPSFWAWRLPRPRCPAAPRTPRWRSQDSAWRGLFWLR